jgi:hypothetical protein
MLRPKILLVSFWQKLMAINLSMLLGREALVAGEDQKEG